MALSFKARLTLWHLVAVVIILVATALVANWALSRAVLDQMVDEAVLSLAEAEGAALTTSPRRRPRSPGSTSSSRSSPWTVGSSRTA